MKVINIEVTDKLKVTSVKDGDNTLTSGNPVKVASGNYKSVLLNFDFKSSTWDETTLEKYATFNIDGQERIQVKLETIGDYENACYLPYSVAKQNCKVNIGVYGASIYNGNVEKVVSSESLYFLIIDGAFNVYLTDESPVKVETIEEIVKADIDEYVDTKKDEFNANYETKINNINSSILEYEEETYYAPYADSKRVEQGIKNYFALTPDDKVYTVKFPLWDTSNTSTGEKLDDNIGKSITPATDTTREVNNYGPAWESVDCNAEVDDNGVRHITAIKGMTTFRDKGKVDVFCLFRTYWQKIWVEDGYLYISRTFVPKEGYTIVPQAVNKDGTYNQWFTIGKYAVGAIDGKLYSSKGLIPVHGGGSAAITNTVNISYSHCITEMKKKGKYYSAGLMADYMHILTSFYIQFATKNTQSIMAGNTDNNRQYVIAVPETNKSRVVITTAQAANIDINTYVSVGDRGTSTNNDRWQAYMHNLAYNVKVIGKEVIDSSNTALILDCEPITTTTTTYVSTMHEVSGYSDNILGRTGSIGSNTNGRHGMVYNGIEIAVGGYEVSGNAIMDIVNSNGLREVYYTNDVTKLSTNINTIKSTFKKSNLTIDPTQISSDGWRYITEYGFDTKNGIAVPTKSGQSGSGSSVGYADGVYVDKGTSGQREFLWLGHLDYGANAGLSCVSATGAMAGAGWAVLARLSINGVGGELAE